MQSDVCKHHLKRLTADYLPEELFWRVPEERNTAHQELVEDDPHRPPVHRLPVALPEDHLGCNVLRCAAHLRKETKSSEKEYSWKRCPSHTLGPEPPPTCLSTNSRVSFSMWPSHRLVAMFIRPILERPKSVSLMWPIDVINKLLGGNDKKGKSSLNQLLLRLFFIRN